MIDISDEVLMTGMLLLTIGDQCEERNILMTDIVSSVIPVNDYYLTKPAVIKQW